MYADGPKRQGRFIKKGAKVLDKISLVDFPFKEINEASVVTHDNANRSIIHHSYHEEQEIDEGVKAPPPRFNNEFLNEDQKRPVIFPMDFTKDWERDKKIRKERIVRAEDEDFDFDYEAARQAEIEAEEAAEAEALAAQRAARADATKKAADAKAEAAPQAAPAGPENRQPEAGPPRPPSESEGPKYQSMEVVGRAILEMAPSTQDLDDISASQVDPSPAAASVPERDDFIPATVTAKGGVQDPELAAARDYQARVEERALREEQLQKIVEEAKAQGYRDGFRVGEERAELMVTQNASQLFGKVAELIQEFVALKQEVLNNVQENFYELCQAMAEALIKREFSIHPEAFVTVLRRAIEEAVEPGKFRIRVHPDTYAKVSGLGGEAQDIVSTLVKDKDIAPGDFKIESEMSVVDVNVGKMINELFQQADLNLFQDEEKAS